MGDVEAIHQPGDIIGYPGVVASCDRVVALWQVDRDFVDDGAGSPAHDEDAIG